ncbi:MAG TPA: efflux RND transporter permease subunit, partial [Armatimonadota bacterium]|nr:efflux RND transporter permease subunit [Armatimonadota bacterium]
MWLTDVSIRRPVFITMVIMALIVLGITAYNKMPNELTPKIEFPFIAIVTVYPGAGPQEMETLVSEPIEDAVGSTGGLRNITSTSRDGVSMVGLEFELGTDLNAAAADVRDKLTAAKARLPRDIEEPTIYKADITSQPIMTIAIEGDMPSKDKRILADTLIKDSFSKIAGVASVSVSGGDIREVSVSVDKNRLDAYGITIDQLAAALRAENLNLPSGSVKEGPDGLSTRSYTVRTVGEFKSADEISNTRINIPGPNG